MMKARHPMASWSLIDRVRPEVVLSRVIPAVSTAVFSGCKEN